MNKQKNVTFSIPVEDAAYSGFAPDGEFTLHAGESLLAMTPREMTALQAAQAIGALTKITTGLLEAIQSACGSCEERREQGLCPSGHLEDPEQCPLKRMTGHGVTVDAGARAEAGIPLDAKLEVFVDEGELLVAAADYEHDITDVPPAVREMLALLGICPGHLDDLIQDGEVICHD